MGLSLFTIAVFLGLALVYMLVPVKWRQWFIFLSSIILIYWLQPNIFVRWLDFFLPSLTIGIASISWYLTRSDEQIFSKDDLAAIFFIVITIIGLALFRYVPIDFRWLVASRPPPLHLVVIFLAIFTIVAYALGKLSFRYSFLLILLVMAFVVLKTEWLAIWVSRLLRTGTGQDVSQTKALDLNWLGFSYVAFRLIHTIRDRQSGILPDLSLRDYVSYILFFPSFIAGPIDRAERFLGDLQALTENTNFQAQYVEGITRISVGIFKKFVIADTLAQGIALSPIHVSQIENPFGAWMLLYGYAFRLYFDFSGYSDIAIGIGILFGIKLPENFAQPYAQLSITKFWQSWHITLSNWVRFYVFSPLSRYLLKRKPKPSPILIVFITQLATMLVIGLWHGVTINFLIWGIWHGLGLFIHKQWADRTRSFYHNLKQKPRQQKLANSLAWVLTFHFVVLGWVWFALPNYDEAVLLFMKLFGLSS